MHPPVCPAQGANLGHLDHPGHLARQEREASRDRLGREPNPAV